MPRVPRALPVSSPFCTVKGMTKLKGLSMDSKGSTGTTGSSVACRGGEVRADSHCLGEGLQKLYPKS